MRERSAFAWNFFIKRIRKKELSQTDNSLLSVKPFCSYMVSNWCQTNPTMPKSDGISRLFSPAASLSGNYDLNGQRSASPCWPSAVAQQRLNRPRLKVCDSLLFTILSLAHALAYVAYSAQYRLHLRLVRTGLPFTRSLYHCIGALQLEISTEPFAQNCKRRFPYDRYYIELLGLLLNAKLSFATWFRLHQPRTVCSGTPQLSAISLIVLTIRPFITPAICQYLV